jgi:hypothetical protein
MSLAPGSSKTPYSSTSYWINTSTFPFYPAFLEMLTAPVLTLPQVCAQSSVCLFYSTHQSLKLTSLLSNQPTICLLSKKHQVLVNFIHLSNPSSPNSVEWIYELV